MKVELMRACLPIQNKTVSAKAEVNS